MLLRAGLLLLGLSSLAFAQGAYLDDRSTPEAVVHSLYNAINLEDFARAWSYFDPNNAPSYSAYIRGFDDTTWVDVRTFPAISVAADEGLAWHVPLVLTAEQDDGTVDVFSGCYFVGQGAPNRRPPYEPIAIRRGHFHTHDGLAETAEGNCTWPESRSISSP